MAKKPNKWDKAHNRNLAAYGRQIDAIYDAAAQEAAKIGVSINDFNPDMLFSFEDYPVTRKRIDKLLQGLNKSVYACIVNGVKSEWTLANNKNNELCNQVFGDRLNELSEAQRRRFYSTNEAARDAFINRKNFGLKLSDRVWNYTNQFKEEIELGLDCGIRDGRGANAMARDLKQYLREPDKLFRRVRDEHGQLQLSKRAAAYHPGQGVYRSSYKNARRLTVTEGNIAYHTADHERWQQLDFVVGIEIVLSNNHPVPDICDDLKGKYPKDFKFTGWHPHCRCSVLSILKTQAEMDKDTDKILAGEPLDVESENTVKDVPKAFKTWLSDNEERLQRSKSVPYFMTDNPKYTGVKANYGAVGAVTGTKLGRTATKAAFKVYDDQPAAKLSKDVAANTAEIAKDFGIKTPPKPMPFLEADDGRGNVSWGKGDEFAANCQSAVAVHEARLRGLNVTALGYDGSKGSAAYQLGEHFEDIWVHPKTKKIPTPTTLQDASFDTMLGKVDKATKATGRYHIGINMSENMGHVITAERLADGQIIFYDAQNGAFLKLEEYAENNVEYFEVLKVDKLLLNKEMFKQIARWL